MQTFLPYQDFDQSARVLDRKRLGGQRKEAVQLLRALEPWLEVGTPELCAKKRAQFEAGEPPSTAWSHHPAALMWKGRVPALLEYLSAMTREWVRRGYKTTLIMPKYDQVELPSWLGDEAFHASHRSSLLRKLPEHYEQFGWTEPNDLEYVWPPTCTGGGFRYGVISAASITPGSILPIEIKPGG